MNSELRDFISPSGLCRASVERVAEMWPADDAGGSPPVRLIEFPRAFPSRLSEFPHPVRRGAMVLLGRLAGGDSAAFTGAKRLKSRPNMVHALV